MFLYFLAYTALICERDSAAEIVERVVTRQKGCGDSDFCFKYDLSS